MATCHMHPFDTSLHDTPARPSFPAQRHTSHHPALAPAWAQTSPISYEFDFPPSISQRGPNPLFVRADVLPARHVRKPLPGLQAGKLYSPGDFDLLRANRAQETQSQTAKKTFDRTRNWAEEVARKGARPAHRYTVSTSSQGLAELRRSRSCSSDESLTPNVIKARQIQAAKEREEAQAALERALTATPVQTDEERGLNRGGTPGTFGPRRVGQVESGIAAPGSVSRQTPLAELPSLLSIPDLPNERAPSPTTPISTVDRSTGRISPVGLGAAPLLVPLEDVSDVLGPASSLAPGTASSPAPSPTPKPSPPTAIMLSIDEIIKQQSLAVDNAITSAKIRARKELRMAIPAKLKLKVADSSLLPLDGPSVKSADAAHGQPISPPKPIPTRTSSAPGAKVAIVLPRTTSNPSFDLNRIQSSCSGSTSFGATTKSLSARSAPDNGPASSEEVHAIAKYLRSPHLHLSIQVPRSYPQEPVNVSFADVGSPNGKPVLLYLGLGGVRHLAAALETLALGCGLRLIAIDRWGLGKTEMIEASDRGVMEWTSITNRILQHLKIRGRVQILAHSAGAPYAMAFARRWPERVKGKVHLLAPWVSSELNDTYKWVKWVPEGVIKVSTKMEHMREGRKFGKAPTLQHKPIEHLKTDDLAEAWQNLSPYQTPIKQQSIAKRASKMFNRQSLTPQKSFGRFGASTDNLPLGRSPKMNDLKTIAALRTSTDIATPPSSNSANSSAASHTILTPPVSRSELDFGLNGGFETFSADLALSIPGSSGQKASAPPRASLSVNRSSERHQSSSPSPSRTRSSADPPTPTPASKKGTRPPPPPTTAAFLEALRQAAHAEAQPGTTADLMLILQKSDTKPWGFKYTDIQARSIVWWGSEDDKIGRRAMEWMRDRCAAELRVVPNVGHDLLSLENVMVEVFDSLRRESWLQAEIEDEEYQDWYFQ